MKINSLNNIKTIYWERISFIMFIIHIMVYTNIQYFRTTREQLIELRSLLTISVRCPYYPFWKSQQTWQQQYSELLVTKFTCKRSNFMSEASLMCPLLASVKLNPSPPPPRSVVIVHLTVQAWGVVGIPFFSNRAGVRSLFIVVKFWRSFDGVSR